MVAAPPPSYAGLCASEPVRMAYTAVLVSVQSSFCHCYFLTQKKVRTAACYSENRRFLHQPGSSLSQGEPRAPSGSSEPLWLLGSAPVQEACVGGGRAGPRGVCRLYDDRELGGERLCFSPLLSPVMLLSLRACDRCHSGPSGRVAATADERCPQGRLRGEGGPRPGGSRRAASPSGSRSSSPDEFRNLPLCRLRGKKKKACIFLQN